MIDKRKYRKYISLFKKIYPEESICNRKHHITIIRSLIMYFLYKDKSRKNKVKLTEIGELFQVGHSTVSKAIKMIKIYIQDEKMLEPTLRNNKNKFTYFYYQYYKIYKNTKKVKIIKNIFMNIFNAFYTGNLTNDAMYNKTENEQSPIYFTVALNLKDKETVVYINTTYWINTEDSPKLLEHLKKGAKVTISSNYIQENKYDRNTEEGTIKYNSLNFIASKIELMTYNTATL